MNNCRCRPTRIFALMLLLWFVMLLQAYMHNYNIVYLMIFFMVGLSVAVLFVARRNVQQLSWHYLSQERVFANTQGRIALLVRNGASSDRFALNATDPFELKLPMLPSGSEEVVTVRVKARSRGVYSITAIGIESHFPLYLFHCLCNYSIEELSFRVYPEPKGEALRKSPAALRGWIGEREDFDGLRRYQKGDPLSLIHWKASVKSDGFYSKQFVHKIERPQMAFSYDALVGSKEERLSQLCLWVLECEREKVDYTVTLKRQSYNSKEYRHDEILDALARF